MGRTQIYNGVELTIPDAYSALDVSRLLTPSAAGVGIVALIGEADGGKKGVNVFAGGTSPKIIRDELKSGEGADMVRLALRAGTDPLVQAGASTVLFVQTNNPTQAQIKVGSSTNPAFILKTKKRGAHTNQFVGEISTVGPAKVLSVRDEMGEAEISDGVGQKSFLTITRAAGPTTATAELKYVAGVLKLLLKEDTGSGVATVLDLNCSNLTLKQLQAQVALVAGYSVQIASIADQGLLVKNLDMVVTPVSTLTTGAAFKASIYELQTWAETQSLSVEVERGNENDATGVVVLTSTAFTGGSRGSTTNSDVQDALNLLLEFRANIIVPLFSEDNQDGSTVSVAAVNAMVKDHVETRSSILGRSESQAYVSIKGNKSAFLAECARLNSRLVSVTSHQITDLGIDGVPKKMREHAFAVVCAQTQAGSPIGTPLTYRKLPVLGITQDISWNPVRDGAEMIKGGALIAGVDENNTIRIINGYTCWLGDSNNANIFIEVVESLAIFAFNHRQFMKQKFLGKSSFTAQDVLDAIKESCEAERDSVRSIKGFKLDEVKLVSTEAGRLEYEVPVIPFEGIVFVLPTVIATRE